MSAHAEIIAELRRVLNERDEARAKLDAEYLRHADAFRLGREQTEHWQRRAQYAFERGAKAMREACAVALMADGLVLSRERAANVVRALPIPEET